MFALKSLCTAVPRTVSASMVLTLSIKDLALCRNICWTGSAIENAIDLTFITPKGVSKTVKARIGDTVLETAEAYDLPICGDCHGNGLPRTVKRTENWTEETYGEGPSCNFCHVILSRELFATVPKAETDEQDWINKITLQKNPKSRLACQIKVSMDMDGGVIQIPNHIPNEIL